MNHEKHLADSHTARAYAMKHDPIYADKLGMKKTQELFTSYTNSAKKHKDTHKRMEDSLFKPKGNKSVRLF